MKSPTLIASGISLGALLLLFASGSPAYSDTWEPVGPSGASFIGSVTDPADADTVTAVTYQPSPHAAYRSTDGGASWNKIGDHPGWWLEDMCAYDFSNLYTITQYGCYASTDGGQSWSYGSFPSGQGSARAVCVDPGNSQNVFAAGYLYSGGVDSLAFFKSTNGGGSWTASSHFSFDDLTVRDMAISQTNSSVMYVIGSKRVGSSTYLAVLRTTDGGVNWTDISSSVEPNTSSALNAVEIDPTDENRIYTGGYSWYTSADGGANWTMHSSFNPNLRDLAIDPTSPNNLYVAHYLGKVSVSTDFGATWSSYPDAYLGNYAVIHVAPATPSTIYIASTGGFFRSTDSGATWSMVVEGINGNVICAIASAPSQPERILVSIEEQSTIQRSDDSGGTWAKTAYPSGCNSAFSLMFNTNNPDIVLAIPYG